LGNLEEGSSTRDFEIRMKGALAMVILFLKRFRGECLGCGFFTRDRDPGRYVQISLRIRASLSIGAPTEPWGTRCLEGGSYTEDFER